MIKSDGERQAPVKVGEAEPTHLARYQFALNFINKSDSVLDIPCGSGYGTNLLSDKAKHVTGIDISVEAIEHAKELFQKDNINFIAQDAEKLSEIFIETDMFDTVISFEGIEHVPNPDIFLSEIRKRITSNGKLIISTPRKPHGSPYHIVEFSLEEFIEILSKDFNIITMYGQIYTDIFDLSLRDENPHKYEKFNFIAECSPK